MSEPNYNINMASLLKKHGGDHPKALSAYKEIAELGGFGTVGDGPGQIHPDYQGGLDCAGVLSDANAAVSEQAKDRIAELGGLPRKSEYKTASSSAKMQKSKD